MWDDTPVVIRDSMAAEITRLQAEITRLRSILAEYIEDHGCYACGREATFGVDDFEHGPDCWVLADRC